MKSMGTPEPQVSEAKLLEIILFMQEKFQQQDQQLKEQGILIKELQEELKRLGDENKQQNTLLREIRDEKSQMQATLDELDARVGYVEAITMTSNGTYVNSFVSSFMVSEEAKLENFSTGKYEFKLKNGLLSTHMWGVHFLSFTLDTLDLGSSEPNFQGPIEAKQATDPVAFQFSRPSSNFGTNGQNVNLVIPFDGFLTNDGNGMTTAGTFTAPISGIYIFMFTAAECSDTGNYARVHTRVDGIPVNSVDMDDSSVGEGGHGRIPGTMHTVVHLREGQQVDTFLSYGLICGNPDSPIQFSGFLIHPTN